MCFKWILVVLLVFVSLLVMKLTQLVLIDFEHQRKFEQFILTYNKSYSKDANETEYYLRFRNFEEALDTSESLNAVRSHDDSAVYGLTEFSDMTSGEFQTQMLRKRKSLKAIRSRVNIGSWRPVRAVDDGLPESFNWVDRGVVSPIRNQGSCGACWAHSVIETIESMLAIAHNETVRDLSVQQMVDCAINNHGCAGGDTCNLLHWLVMRDVPIVPMHSYPTTNSQSTCEMQSMASGSNAINEYTTVKAFTCQSLVNQEHRILDYLATTGPVTVGVNALTWQYYLGGIIQHHCDGNAATLNHAVQIVGYDRSGDVPFYIVRNSWGKDFGDHGYAKIEIGSNLCGIATQVSTISVK